MEVGVSASVSVSAGQEARTTAGQETGATICPALRLVRRYAEMRAHVVRARPTKRMAIFCTVGTLARRVKTS